MDYRFLAPDGGYYDVPSDNFSSAVGQGGAPVEVSPEVRVLSSAGEIEKLHHSDAADKIRSQGYRLLKTEKNLKMVGPGGGLFNVAPQDVSEGIQQGGIPVVRELASSKPITPDIAKAGTAYDENPLFANWFGPTPKDPSKLKNFDEYTKILELNRKKRAGLLEGLTPDGANVPFIGAALEAVDIGKVAISANKLTKGERVSDQDVLDMNIYLAEMDRMSNATMLGKAGKVIVDMTTFMTEIGGSIATALFGGAGVAGFATAAGGKGALKAAKVAVKKALKEKTLGQLREEQKLKAANLFTTKILGKEAVDSLQRAGKSGVIAGNVADTLVAAVAPTVGQVLPQAVATKLAGQEAGTSFGNQERVFNSIMGKDTEPNVAFWRGTGDTFIENLSEASGEFLLSLGAKAMNFTRLGPAAQAIRAGSFKRLKAMGLDGDMLKAAADKNAGLAALSTWVGRTMARDGVTYKQAMEKFATVGYNGVVGEMLEERAGGFMRGLFGLAGEEDDNACRRFKIMAN